MCAIYSCPDCHDRLIHQSKRGPDESSSAFGQWIHDELTKEMFAPDLDVIIGKLRTKILRVLEHKPRGKSLSDSQKAILPLLAKAIQLLAATGLIHRDSGVFMVQSDPPYESAMVWQIEGWSSRRTELVRRELRGTPWRSFMEGEVLELDGASAEALRASGT